MYLEDSGTSPKSALYNIWNSSPLLIASPPLSVFLISLARSIKLIASVNCVAGDLINSLPNMTLVVISAVSWIVMFSNGLNFGPFPMSLKSLPKFA